LLRGSSVENAANVPRAERRVPRLPAFFSVNLLTTSVSSPPAAAASTAAVWGRTHSPLRHVSPLVHGSPSSQDAPSGSGVSWQPSEGSHVVRSQRPPRAQTRGSLTQRPREQRSLVVQRSSSAHWSSEVQQDVAPVWLQRRLRASQ